MCLLPGTRTTKKKEILYELPEFEIFQLLEDEVTRFLTGFNTPWQLHVPREGRSSIYQRTCELQKEDSMVYVSKTQKNLEGCNCTGASSLVRSQKRSRHDI